MSEKILLSPSVVANDGEIDRAAYDERVGYIQMHEGPMDDRYPAFNIEAIELGIPDGAVVFKKGGGTITNDEYARVAVNRHITALGLDRV
jgi:hypothetical protein